MQNILPELKKIIFCKTTHLTVVRDFVSHNMVYGARKVHVTIVRIIVGVLGMHENQQH